MIQYDIEALEIERSNMLLHKRADSYIGHCDERWLAVNRHNGKIYSDYDSPDSWFIKLGWGAVSKNEDNFTF